MQEFRINFVEDTRSYLDIIHNEIQADKEDIGLRRMKLLTELLFVTLKAICEPIILILVSLLLFDEGMGIFIPLVVLPIILVLIARHLDPTAKPNSFPRSLVAIATLLAAFSLPFVVFISIPFFVQPTMMQSSLGGLIVFAALVWLYMAYRPKKHFLSKPIH